MTGSPKRDKLFKILKIFFLLLALVCLTSLIYFYYRGHTSNTKTEDKNISRYNFPKPSHDIHGFRFDGTNGERRVITIEADRFSIRKKKLGLFGFGLMNVARLENASIHIFGKDRLTEQKADESHVNVDSSQNLAFNDLFSKDALPTFPIKRVQSIEMAPVCVMLHDEKSVVTQISATSATIRAKKQDILFKGDIRVVSGSRSLMTDRLILLPEKAIVKADQHFILKTLEKQTEGDRLTADIFLRSLAQ